MERTIIFCSKYDECSELYTCIRRALGNEFTEPVGAPDLARFRLVGMYTACTSKSVRDAIVRGFCSSSSVLRVVIATVAFGSRHSITSLALWHSFMHRSF